MKQNRLGKNIQLGLFNIVAQLEEQSYPGPDDPSSYPVISYFYTLRN